MEFADLIYEGPVSSALIESLCMDEELHAFRPPLRQKEALLGITQIPEGRVILAHCGSQILGYVTFHPPDSFERWSKGPKEVIELGAIEVSPKIRNFGVGKKLLDAAFSDPHMEDYIIVVTEYYWHWDLEKSGLQVWEYRELMRRLMTHAGMVVKDTDEEEITSHPANMLMVRYGKNLNEETIRAFENILFLGIG